MSTTAGQTDRIFSCPTSIGCRQRLPRVWGGGPVQVAADRDLSRRTVSHVNAVAEMSGCRPPVCVRSTEHSSERSDSTASGTQACHNEWQRQGRIFFILPPSLRHIVDIHDQPVEVLQHAYGIFRRVYDHHGPVTGGKARALILVSLLYSGRLLHGNNKTNEEYLIRQLNIPTRIMNRAFSLLASVTLQPGHCLRA